MKGQENGWYYDCYGERTYPVDERLSLDDGDRLEFLLRGWSVSSTCDGKQFFVHPHTGYFPTPRQAVDCTIDIMRQKEWRCYESGCLKTAIYRIFHLGLPRNFKKCVEHTRQYRGLDRWKIEELTP